MFGGVDNYNYSRGHLLHFDAHANYLNAFPFGWDITLGVYLHDGTAKNRTRGVWTLCWLLLVCRAAGGLRWGKQRTAATAV